ncbi:PHB depolymerase family esterase [uncultured Piscinibacter sp.]|uniref:extracellular catalytic domain type 1 short-chain-length polyhydroxyalkanoate depolymerase n=1 Tax=uncultured Piscinibacter sp. TaxID=1131835 RepID=UPI002616DA42|nr:PHB depolymerase family esterase [uncultured Piscinibacter sp.]
MKNPFHGLAPPFDADAINETIQRALAAAGLDTQAGPMRDVTETVRRALASGRPGGAAPNSDHASVIDVDARVVPAGADTDTDPATARRRQPSTGEARQWRGSVETHEFGNDAGRRIYKVYVPAGTCDAPRATVVMLHGCTQSADDFAAGTQMNRLADEHGFLVVYPEQPAQANASKCWNWFQPQDQRRGTGEPALIAGIVTEVVQRQGGDPRRVFVAGLSAGAAMAVVLGQTYPELFAGVGAHSGLPYGSAHDLPSALAAMKGGRSGMPGLKGAGTPQGKASQAVPVIVFHGDRDHTVRPTNGAGIAQQARDAHAAQRPGADLQVSTQSGVAPGGRRFSRTVHADREGRARIESWTLHGAGHAWSGGHASGSYTDGSGPDASAEMVRFFLALPRAGSA